MDVIFPNKYAYRHGVTLGCFDGAWGSVIACVQCTNAEAFSAYVEQIASMEGVSLWANNYIGENRFYTWRLPEGALHAYYTAYSKTVRLVFDPLTHSALPPQSDDAGKKVTEPMLGVLSLDYSHRDITDANGMCYVIMLGDGSYIVYDGGYTQDCDRLYAFLKAHNRRPDGRIVIAAWVLTHSHEDHYLAFAAFTERYADRVCVEYFVANPTSPALFTNPKAYDPFLTDRFPELCKAYQGAKTVKLQTGQRMAVREAVIEAYCSFTDLLPAKLPYLNLASLVTKLHLAGQELLFLADAELSTDVHLPLMFGNALKSDILQVAHHGYSGGNEQMFRLIDPQVALWTTSQIAFDIRTSPVWPRPQSHYLVLEQRVQYCIPADGPCKLLPLPFTGRIDEWEWEL